MPCVGLDVFAHAGSPINPRAKARASNGLQIVDAFADADRHHRQLELLGQRHQHAALGAAVELGHHQRVDRRQALEGLDLGMGVLADRGVEHQQAGMRRRGIELADARARSWRALPSGWSCCAGGPRCRSAARRSPRPGRAPAPRRRGPRRRRRWALAITGTPARSPHTLSCSTAAARKVSPAASITLRPSPLKRWASLAMVVVLPLPLTPITSTTCGLRAGSMASGLATGCRISAMSSAKAARTSSSVTSLPKRSLPSLSTRRAATADAEIGLDQRVLQVVERLLVELLLGEEAGDALGDALGRLAGPRADGQPALLWLRLGAQALARSFGSGAPDSPSHWAPSRRTAFRLFGLRVSLTGHLRSSERSSSPLKASAMPPVISTWSSRSHSMVSVPPSQHDVGLALHQAAPAGGDHGGAGARAAGERQAGAALPDAQPQPCPRRPAGRRRYWRARERTRSCSSFGPSSASGMASTSSTKNVACGLPMLVPTGSCSGPAPTGM